MPDPNFDDLLKKDFKLELSKFRTKTKPTLAEALQLRLQKAELEKDKAADPKQLQAIDLSLKKLTLKLETDADALQSQLARSLKNYKGEAKDPRGLAKWYADIVDKESGIDVGKDLKLWGNVDFGSKEVQLEVKGKF
jgi:hypothetical protein